TIDVDRFETKATAAAAVEAHRLSLFDAYDRLVRFRGHATGRARYMFAPCLQCIDDDRMDGCQ
ncbi:hypothetical protein RDWZM_000591, partial [Blomia tropicalis]